MESKFPKQFQNAFNGMERNGNPWNINKDRLEWAKEDESLEVKTVTENPARLLGIEESKGNIKIGKDADIVILDEDYSVWTTIVRGRIVYRKDKGHEG